MADQKNEVYEDFHPSTGWAREDKFDTLIVHLPGFKKEDLKVREISPNKLKISGERRVGDNKRKRFSKEIEIPSYCDARKISAKFEGGTLYIKHPKVNPEDQSSKAASKPQKPETDHQGVTSPHANASADYHAKQISTASRDKSRVEHLKALSGLATKMKLPRKFVSLILAVLLVLLAWLYARNYAIRPIGKAIILI